MILVKDLQRYQRSKLEVEKNICQLGWPWAYGFEPGWLADISFDLKLWPLISLQPLDQNWCLVPHLKDLCHIFWRSKSKAFEWILRYVIMVQSSPIYYIKWACWFSIWHHCMLTKQKSFNKFANFICRSLVHNMRRFYYDTVYQCSKALNKPTRILILEFLAAGVIRVALVMTENFWFAYSSSEFHSFSLGFVTGHTKFMLTKGGR